MFDPHTAKQRKEAHGLYAFVSLFGELIFVVPVERSASLGRYFAFISKGS